ncbi:excisionase family DNA-binding protein [Saccharothrix variisporea]|uniref:Excisionase family DNA binding protein n=1 Tax=Saccharothrix variisporea TaxID=543527 RepID=A0A495X099_9PSEU|nr:excisionase family DNA-binding protein [Saccharothrix variisporea]RKT67089.1 excisionase family DNA binding protein [Saccharothrix variisporea]
MNEWLTVDLVAQRVNRHKVTVRRALESGEMHGHQTGRGGRWSVAAAAIDAWVQGIDGVDACGCAKARGVP